MRSVKAVLLALVLMVGFSTVASAWPEGAPRRVSVSGPGLNGDVMVTEPALMVGLGPEQLIDYMQGARPPGGLSGGFTLVRYSGLDSRADALFIDRLVYYPHRAGGRGYIQYLGSEQGGGEAFKGKWFFSTIEGDAAMRKLLKYVGAPLAQSSSLPETSLTVALDALPASMSAGELFRVGFTVSRQGRAVSAGDPILIYALEAGASSQTVFSAHPSGATGHYVAEVNVPRDGLWFWAIDLGPLDGEREMTPWSLSATPSAPQTQSSRDQMRKVESYGLAGLIAVILAAILGVLWLRVRRHQPAV